jgi:hypothetical protein
MPTAKIFTLERDKNEEVSTSTILIYQKHRSIGPQHESHMRAFVWFIIRLCLLNGFVIASVGFISVCRQVLEYGSLSHAHIPFELSAILVFISNFTYLVGLGLELAYIRIWKLQTTFAAIEPKFFKAAIMLGVLILATAAVIYFLNLI